jgi:hypothetical protein
MARLTHYPFLLFAVVFLALSLAAWGGQWLRRRRPVAGEGWDEDFGVVAGATLTLLALIIGFSFSMAAERYGQRKAFEEGEANAIGTEILRADLLPQAQIGPVRTRLGAYLDQRILYFNTADPAQVARIDRRTDQIQDELWTEVRGAAAAQPTPVMTLVASGMNDVFNSRGYTQAAFWNRIPPAAWWLMAVLSLLSNALLGYGSHSAGMRRGLILVLPLVVSSALLLIADIDSPGRGLIKVSPENLMSVAASLKR